MKLSRNPTFAIHILDSEISAPSNLSAKPEFGAGVVGGVAVLAVLGVVMGYLARRKSDKPEDEASGSGSGRGGGRRRGWAAYKHALREAAGEFRQKKKELRRQRRRGGGHTRSGLSDLEKVVGESRTFAPSSER